MKKFLIVLFALVLVATATAGSAGYGSQGRPSVYDSENNLYDKDEDAKKTTSDSHHQDMNDKYLDQADQFSANSKAAKADRFKKQNSAQKQKGADKAAKKTSLKARERDDVDKMDNKTKFAQQKLNKKDTANNKRFTNKDQSDEGKTSEKLKKDNKSKKSKRSSNGKSFANHAEGDDNEDLDLVSGSSGSTGDGGKHAAKKKHHQEHSFGNSYGDDEMNASDKSSVDAAKKGKFAKKNKMTDFENNNRDSSIDKHDTDFGKSDKRLKQRRGKTVDQDSDMSTDKSFSKSARDNNIAKDSQASRQSAIAKAAKKKAAKKSASKNMNAAFNTSAARKKKIIRDVDHKKQ